MKRIKIIAMLVVSLMAVTSCSKSLEEKIADGDDLNSDNYIEMMEYSNEAFEELAELNSLAFSSQEELDEIQEEIVNIVAEYPEVGTYISIIKRAKADNDKELQEAADEESDTYYTFMSYADRWGFFFR